MNHCKICLKHQQEDPYFVAERGNFRIYHSPTDSQLLGYLYLEPSRHVEFWSELSEQEREELPYLIAKLEQWLKVEVGAQKVYTLTVGETVRHLHMHLIPRSTNSPLESMELIQQVAVRKGVFAATPLKEEAIQILVGKLRDHLST